MALPSLLLVHVCARPKAEPDQVGREAEMMLGCSCLQDISSRSCLDLRVNVMFVSRSVDYASSGSRKVKS